jgi:glycosyltransferase involved in cell wall biosynthesis
MPRLQRRPDAPLRLARGVLALRRLAGEVEAALVHANVLRAAIYALPAARLAGLPLVWHVRDIHPRGPAARLLCRGADAVIAISEAVAGALPCSSRAQVIYNPIDEAEARPRTRVELGLPAEGLLVAHVGRLRPWKGQRAFLAAAARLRHPDARFVVIGGRILDDDEQGYADELVALASSLGLAGRVTFTGQRDDLADVWPHLSILAHTATAEPFGRVVAEALRAGVPVVAFADGGVPEIVDDGETGRLVAAGDVDALAQAIDELLASPTVRARMGRLGQQRAEKRFAPAWHARAVERVYDSLSG